MREAIRFGSEHCLSVELFAVDDFVTVLAG